MVAPPRRLGSGRRGPGPPADRVVDRFAELDRASVAVLGDPGAGNAAQQAVAPVLLAAAATPTWPWHAATSVRPQAGCGPTRAAPGPYADYPAPIYGVPGPTTGATASPAS